MCTHIQCANCMRYNVNEAKHKEQIQFTLEILQIFHLLGQSQKEFKDHQGCHRKTCA